MVPLIKKRSLTKKSKKRIVLTAIKKKQNFIKNASISQAIKIKRNGLNQTIIKEIEEDQIEEDDFFSIENLSQAHLEILLSKIRENNWTHIHERGFATSIYMVLKLAGLSRNKIGQILSNLGSLSDRTAHRYASQFINGDEEALFEERRGKYQRDDIFEMIPELSEDIKKYTIEKVSQKDASFTLDDLLKYSKVLFCLYEPDLEPDLYITLKGLNRLISSWGFFWGKNKARPYINGHEREDVVKKRKEFVKYFIDQKATHHIYVKKEYTKMEINLKISEKEYYWHFPDYLDKTRILIAHDESTFRSGEIQSERWLHHEYSPLFNKGF